MVSSLELNHKQIDIAHRGEEVCVKIEPTGGDAPKLYGRHFDHTDLLVSKVQVRGPSFGGGGYGGRNMCPFWRSFFKALMILEYMKGL